MVSDEQAKIDARAIAVMDRIMPVMQKHIRQYFVQNGVSTSEQQACAEVAFCLRQLMQLMREPVSKENDQKIDIQIQLLHEALEE